MQSPKFTFLTFIRFQDANAHRLLRIAPLIALNFALPAACSGVPFEECRGASQGGASACEVDAADATAAGGAPEINTLPSGGQSNAQTSPVPNGSFEVDEQPSTTPASAPPSGWTMLSSASPGNLLHALRGDGIATPKAAQGQNVAAFDSLTASSYREALSACFPIKGGQAARAVYQVMIPLTQSAAGTRAAVKIVYFQDAACLTPSAIRTADTQNASSNSAPGVWEMKQYAPSQPSPADAMAARISIRAAYNAGTDCGAAGTHCAEDKMYFDAIGFEPSK